MVVISMVMPISARLPWMIWASVLRALVPTTMLVLKPSG